MKAHKPELISALLDGELTGLRRWLTARHVTRCATCTAESQRLRRVRELLAANPVAPVMSDTPEFFWSKVKRDIQAHGQSPATIPVPQLSWTDWLDQRRYAFATATVALLVALGVVWTLTPRRPATTVAHVALATVEHVGTALPNTTATAFEAPEAEATVIWVTGLPWTKDMTEMQTLFATLDS